MFTPTSRASSRPVIASSSRTIIRISMCTTVIEAIGNDNRLSVKMDDGRTVNFDPARMPHFDHGYAVTSHSSQSLTESRVLVNMDTNSFSELLNPRFAYVSISRASQDAHIYTNDAATLAQRLSTDVSKTSALDFC